MITMNGHEPNFDQYKLSLIETDLLDYYNIMRLYAGLLICKYQVATD